MKKIILFLKLNKFVLSFRIKLIRLIVGRLSIAANIVTDGDIGVGDGLVYNVHFAHEVSPEIYTVAYNARVHGWLGRIVITDYCVFDAPSSA